MDSGRCMAKKLVIVESPAKAKTIEKFLGTGFEVRASMGHILDLPKKGMGVALPKKGKKTPGEHDFEPKYEVIERKEKLISELKSAAKKAETIYLAPDPDREGEFIAWSLKSALGLKNPQRAVFNEITKRAVQDAIAHPRLIDENLFNAQQARRVLDRLVGYKISPLLWRRVQSGTSAGRVQSVALRLICNREAEIRAFVPEEYWTIEATLSKLNDRRTFVATLLGRAADLDKSGANGSSTAETPLNSGHFGHEGTAEGSADGGQASSNGSNGKADGKGENGKSEKGRIKIGSEQEAQALLRALQGAKYVVL